MRTIQGANYHLCDRIARREFLLVGIGALGLSLPPLLRAGAGRSVDCPAVGRAQTCILLFLTGGPPQLDTFDLKPDAPAEIRGEFRPIATSVTGLHVGELCPQLARQADKFCILRAVTHTDSVHTSAGYTMLTGVTHPLVNAPGGAATRRPTANDHPHLGSLLAKERPARQGVPAFAALPEVIKDAGVNEFPGQGGGFLGKVYDPFRIEAERNGFRLPDIVLPADVPAERLNERRFLLERLDRAGRTLGNYAVSTDVDRFQQQAFALLRSPGLRRAIELER